MGLCKEFEQGQDHNEDLLFPFAGRPARTSPSTMVTAPYSQTRTALRRESGTVSHVTAMPTCGAWTGERNPSTPASTSATQSVSSLTPRLSCASTRTRPHREHASTLQALSCLPPIRQQLHPNQPRLQ